MLTARGSVVLTHFQHGAADIEVAESREAMAVRLLTSKSLDSWWASSGHLDALKRVREKLDETIAKVEKDRDSETGNTVLEESEEP